MTDIHFSDLTLSAGMLSALDEMGYVHPTPVQIKSIPLVATGADLMVQSQTGTGKTAAFGIPVIEALGDNPRGVRALVLGPTRELAKQVAEELARLGKNKKIQTAAVYGGASMEKQVAELRFSSVVSGTPGRLLDHLRRGTLKVDQLSHLVLDEADEMLSMGFARELSSIMQFLPKDRQTLLFSATIPEDIKRYAKRYMKEPEFLSLVEENVAADQVEHHYYMVSGVGRTRDLVQIIEYEDPESALIFTNTKKDTELVARYLRRQGYDAEFLNGDLPQRERERVMGKIKNKEIRFLVATDIAARGIDISQLSHVINFILPESPESYIHRSGRTGRAGREGTAISLIGPREIGVFYYLKRIYNVALQEQAVPTQSEIDLRRHERLTQALVDEILEATRTLAHPAELNAQAMRILERDDAPQIVRSLLAAFRTRGTVKPVIGGMLADVPKPARIAAGSRPQTVADVAARVAVMRGEFRGLPGKTDAKTDAKTDTKTDADKAATPLRERPSRKRKRSETVEAKTEQPKTEQPKTEQPKAEQPKAEQPKAEQPKAEQPKAEQPKATRPRKKRPTKRRMLSSEATKAPVETKPTPKTQPEPKAQPAPKVEAKPAPKVEAKPAPKVEAKPAPKVEAQVDEAQPEAQPEPRTDGRSRNRAPRLKAVEGSRLLFLNVGRRDRISPEDLREQLADLAGLLPEDIHEVSMRGRHSYLLVDDQYAEDLIEAVDGETLGQKAIRVEFAKDED